MNWLIVVKFLKHVTHGTLFEAQNSELEKTQRTKHGSKAWIQEFWMLTAWHLIAMQTSRLYRYLFGIWNMWFPNKLSFFFGFRDLFGNAIPNKLSSKWWIHNTNYLLCIWLNWTKLDQDFYSLDDNLLLGWATKWGKNGSFCLDPNVNLGQMRLNRSHPCMSVICPSYVYVSYSWP